jgi:hypothetical protein
MGEWVEYFDGKLAMVCDGYVLVKPRETIEAVPLACPVCDMLMATRDDVDNYRQKRCCEKCALRWADRYLSKWKDGWRPSKSEVEEEVLARQSIPLSVNVEFGDE